MVAQDPTVFIVDDNETYLDSLSALISSMGMKTRCFRSADEYLAAFDPKRPGCLILDVRLPGLNGLDLQERLRREPLGPPVIVVTGYADVPMALRAVRQGAVEFLQKTFTEGELWDALQQAITIDEDNRRAHADLMEKQSRLKKLTLGELEVLYQILLGRSNKNIATTLKLSLRAVEDRRARIMQKFKVESLADLVRLANDLGLCDAAE